MPKYRAVSTAPGKNFRAGGMWGNDGNSPFLRPFFCFSDKNHRENFVDIDKRRPLIYDKENNTDLPI